MVGWKTCDSSGDPNRVGPSQAPLNFVDGNGYIVLRGVVDANYCEGGVGQGDEGVGQWRREYGGKKFALLFNAGLSQEQATDPALPRRWQSKGSLR